MSDTTDHLRRLAGLFLTDADKRESSEYTTSRATRTHRPFVEMILVGHLPVRAGLWLTQYADEVARDDGPTGLIRLDGEQPILEVLRGSQATAEASAAATLTEALKIAQREINRWVMRPSLTTAAESILDADADLITILTGADEVAVVAAYRVLKELADIASETDRHIPAIELAVLGADREQAHAAADRLASTALQHLGIEVVMRRCIRAMGALGSTLHFRFPSDTPHEVAELIQMLRRESAEAPVIETQPTALPLETPAPEQEAAVEHPNDRLSHLASSVPSSAPGTDFDVPHTETRKWAATPAPAASPASAPGTAPARLQPKPSIHVEAKPVVAQVSSKPVPPSKPLASWIEGLAKLPVECADAKQVEIAVDTAGVVHLVAWEDRLRDMHVVESWVRKNIALIAMACAEHTIEDAHVEPVFHLVTSEPAKVTSLCASDIRLHILAPVDVQGQTGWYAAKLNW